MQVIGNMYEKILKKNNLKINIVVATSGDTGAAAISAIKDRKKYENFLFYIQIIKYLKFKENL